MRDGEKAMIINVQQSINIRMIKIEGIHELFRLPNRYFRDDYTRFLLI